MSVLKNLQCANLSTILRYELLELCIIFDWLECVLGPDSEENPKLQQVSCVLHVPFTV